MKSNALNSAQVYLQWSKNTTTNNPTTAPYIYSDKRQESYYATLYYYKLYNEIYPTCTRQNLLSNTCQNYPLLSDQKIQTWRVAGLGGPKSGIFPGATP